MKQVDHFGMRRFRQWATAAAGGRVLEIGVGSGPNLEHYPPAALEIIAFDPELDSLLLTRGEKEAGLGRARMVCTRAERLPFPDATFDSAIGTLVFCTVPDAAAGLGEVRRVLKPGAPLRLVEHVRANNPILSAIQTGVTPVWKRMAGGCHLDRNTRRVVEQAGFRVVATRERWAGMFIGLDAVK